MSLKNRLAKLEKVLGRRAPCPQCHDSPVQQICMYDEQPDGTLRLVSGTPPTPCPACGRMPSLDDIWAIITKLPKETNDSGEVQSTNSANDSVEGETVE
jgi:hypothetical protein